MKNIHQYMIPAALLVLLLLTIPTTSFYGGTVIGRYLPKPKPTQMPVTILGVNNGPSCQKYGIILDPKVTPPSNFPGYKKSSLLTFHGEITGIAKNEWQISNGHSSKDFIIDSNVILDLIYGENYKVGDCVTVFYGLKKGFHEKVYSVSMQ